ncbi:MAG: hypothetical protein F2842_07345 [Actinobacteria bacterium]|uniref:Unannotated protein n=1 Tax=freshwater metagenome TaxID=449393 RepID=A0A6J7KCF9_9ZZZZ|nr:hypothetical protein [Actinomycetota bacterium]
MTLAIGFLWLVTASVRRYAARRRDLLAERECLAVLQSQAAVQLQQLDEEAAEQVRASVLEGLGSDEPARGDEVLRRMRLTLDDVVRPLSRQLESQGQAWVETVGPDVDYRVRWWPTVTDALDPARIHPVLIFAMMEVVLIASAPRYGVAVSGIVGLSALLVLLPLLWLLRRVGTRLTRHATVAVRSLAFAVALVVPGAAFGRVDLLYPAWSTLSTPFPLALAVFTALFTFLFGLVLALVDSALSQARAVEEELKETTADMRWALARAREEHRQHRLALAHAVHGRIQATLSAAVLQLDAAMRDGTADEAMVADVQARVMACVTSLDLRFTRPDGLPEVLDKLRTTWSGLADVTLVPDEMVESVLAGDVQSLRCINDVLPELVFNAIKHGRARHVQTTLRMQSREALELVVRDDGVPEGVGVSGGMGSRMLDDCSIEWSRKRVDEATVTRVVLPALANHESRIEAVLSGVLTR